MVITAKFNSRCPRCGQFISTGDEIEWERGKKARHVECPNLSAIAIQEGEVGGGPEKTGQLWESCRCGQEPVYMPLMLCDRCWPTGPVVPQIDTTCPEPYRRGIGQGFGATEDGDF